VKGGTSTLTDATAPWVDANPKTCTLTCHRCGVHGNTAPTAGFAKLGRQLHAFAKIHSACAPTEARA